MKALIISFSITIVFVLFYIVLKKIEREDKTKNRIDTQIRMRAPDEVKPEKENKDFRGRLKHVLKSLTLKMKKNYKSGASTQNEDELQKRLLRAGNPFRMTVVDYFIINNVIRVAVPLLFLAMALIMKLTIIRTISIVLIGFALSFKTLDFYLSSKTKERYKKALRELPDFLDILTISVEAGLGFDLALSKTIEKRNGILPTEFNICLEEMRLGKTRRDALSGVKDRLNFDEMIAFVNSIIQSEKMGMGIVNTLRTKSEDERDKRKQRAEEEAMKTTIKILFPLVFFIFPSLFIVILGPAVIQLLKML